MYDIIQLNGKSQEDLVAIARNLQIKKADFGVPAQSEEAGLMESHHRAKAFWKATRPPWHADTHQGTQRP